MICENALLFDAVKAIKQAHHYREPALDLMKLEN